MTTPETPPDAHVVVLLPKDEDGWPPMRSERLWARNLGGDTYRIANIPFFARDLAFGDEVVARPSAPDGDPTFVELLRRSANLTLRFIVGDGHTTQRAVDLLEPHGVGIEGMASYKLLAVDVPPEVDLRALAATVTRGESDGVWAWEEGRISRAWVDAVANS